MPHLKKGLSLLGDVLVKLPISCWPVPLGIPCISYFSNFMFWHINIYFKSDLFEIWSFYFLFCVDLCYMSISISTPTWIWKTLHSIKIKTWPVTSLIQNTLLQMFCWILDSLCSLFGHFQPNFQKYWKVQNESLGGHMLFGIAGIVQVEKGDRRITLQCGPPPILHFVFETCLTAP